VRDNFLNIRATILDRVEGEIRGKPRDVNIAAALLLLVTCLCIKRRFIRLVFVLKHYIILGTFFELISTVHPLFLHCILMTVGPR